MELCAESTATKMGKIPGLIPISIAPKSHPVSLIHHPHFSPHFSVVRSAGNPARGGNVPGSAGY